jgi:hypothetical protein
MHFLVFPLAAGPSAPPLWIIIFTRSLCLFLDVCLLPLPDSNNQPIAARTAIKWIKNGGATSDVTIVASIVPIQADFYSEPFRPSLVAALRLSQNLNCNLRPYSVPVLMAVQPSCPCLRRLVYAKGVGPGGSFCAGSFIVLP